MLLNVINVFIVVVVFVVVFILSAFPPQIIQVQPQVIEVLAGETSTLFCNASRQSTL